MIKNTHRKFFLAFTIVMVVIGTQYPIKVQAATPDPSCIMAIATNAGIRIIRDTETVFFKEHSNVIVVWRGSDATKVTTIKGDSTNLIGGMAVSPIVQSTYKYTFSGNTKTVSCAVTLIPVTASFTASTLVSKDENPTLQGRVYGSKTVQLEVRPIGATTSIFTSTVVSVKNNHFAIRITKDLVDGEYTVILKGDKTVSLNTIATATIKIGNVIPSVIKADTTLVVVNVPLLIGGVAKAGSLVPISYIQVLNVGSKPAILDGFAVTQTGSAPVASILSLSSVDDTGTLISPIEGVAGTLQFKNATAFIPTKVILSPGQMHLFTLKAAIVNTVTPFVGTQLKMVMSSISSNAAVVKGTFPIQGTTWTIAL